MKPKCGGLGNWNKKNTYVCACGEGYRHKTLFKAHIKKCNYCEDNKIKPKDI